MLREIDDAIAAGAGVLLFPEGTASRGASILPLRAALLEWAARSGHPVHVAAVRYATEDLERPASEAVCWWGVTTPILPHFLGLAALPRIHAEVVLATPPSASRPGPPWRRPSTAKTKIFTPMTDAAARCEP